MEGEHRIMKRRKKRQPHHRQKPRKKTERGNSRQVLKMELRNMTFGEEELSYYGEVGLSAFGAGRYNKFAA